MAALEPFSSQLDRAAERRDDPYWLQDALADGVRVVPVWRGRNLVSGDPPRAVYAPITALDGGAVEDTILLGVASDGTSYVAVVLSENHDEATALSGLGSDAARFTDLRSLRAMLAGDDAAILGYASALAHWNAVTRFCSGCGAPTRSLSAGHVRICTNPGDGRRHFPRTDPAVIMLVHDGDRALLGRQPEWPPRMYSALAGFVEPGERLEDTVRREVREESGIAVDDVRYYASQPWPFPQSLMLGFFARATSREIVRGEELEDVRWFTRPEIAELERERALALPGVDTIARRLIGAWERNEHVAGLLHSLAK